MLLRQFLPTSLKLHSPPVYRSIEGKLTDQAFDSAFNIDLVIVSLIRLKFVSLMHLNHVAALCP